LEDWLGAGSDKRCLAAVLAALCLAAFAVGIRLIAARPARASQGQRQTSRSRPGETLLPASELLAEPAAPIALSAEASAYWPADKAIGQGWARASDLAQAPKTPKAP
jgi:hypothetical protein